MTQQEFPDLPYLMLGHSMGSFLIRQYITENMGAYAEGLKGVAAVIDKDHAASLLARDLDADVLLILTEVEKVSLNFRKPDQKDLDHMTVGEARRYIEEGHFAPGSMLPKVKAAVDFAVSGPGRRAIITSLYKAADALNGLTGTVIENN